MKIPVRRRDPLTLKHYTLFGRITVEYASVEVGMRILLAGYMGQGIPRSLVLSAPYTSIQLRNVVKASTKLLIPADTPLYRVIIDAIGAHKAAGTLRNDIAHNSWRKGTRASAIAPTYMEIRNEKAEFKGFEDEDRNYTIGDLEATLAGLIRANERLAALQFTAEFDHLIERNISDNNEAIDSSDGIS